MIEIGLNKIKVDELKQEQVLIFREKEGKRFLPIVVGLTEVNAIKMKISRVDLPRPLTHDLLLNTMHALDTKLKSVSITKLEQQTFFAKLELERADGETLFIDSRPSDAVALAIASEVPIFVEEEVLTLAGMQQN